MGLKDILGEELFRQVEATLKGKGKDGKDIALAIANDGSFFPKAKFDEINDVNKTLKEQLEAANKQIEGFKGLDIEGVKKAAEEWKTKAEKAEAEAKTRIETLQFDHALESALLGARAKNAKAVKALIDADALKLKDGEIIGLSEQLEKLKADNDFLFEAAKPPEGDPPGSYQYKPAGGGPEPDYSKMSDAEYYAATAKK